MKLLQILDKGMDYTVYSFNVSDEFSFSEQEKEYLRVQCLQWTLTQIPDESMKTALEIVEWAANRD